MYCIQNKNESIKRRVVGNLIYLKCEYGDIDNFEAQYIIFGNDLAKQCQLVYIVAQFFKLAKKLAN